MKLIVTVAIVGGVLVGVVAGRQYATGPTFRHAGSSAVGPGDLVGRARVIDGDTIEIRGTRVRLEGIDAPETAQACRGRFGTRWRAGVTATKVLREKIKSRLVICKGRKLDRYDRLIATCFVDDKDLNAAMVSTGNAWAFRKYSKTYVEHERRAAANRLGIWSASCQTAWEFRERRWAAGSSQAPAGCPIKGNITRAGKIYHPPWSPWYGRTKVSPERGERWFCSEREALDAGWRPVGSA